MKKRRPAKPQSVPELADWQVEALAVIAHARVAPELLFSGGAALAAVHLHHRVSADLDFFLARPVEPTDLHDIARKLRGQGVLADIATVGPRVSIVLTRDGSEFGRIDFAWYPYEPIGRRLRWRGLAVDSLVDIAANKIQAVLTRFQPRDFVDLYLLLREGPEQDIERLLELSRTKFDTGADRLGLAARLLLVHEVTELPPLLRPVSVGDLVVFFDDVARGLARKVE